jgi:YHS domain-containing protein
MKEQNTLVRDPVCGMQIDPEKAAAMRVHMGLTFHFCSPGCAQAFDADPHRFTGMQQSGSPSNRNDTGGQAEEAISKRVPLLLPRPASLPERRR